MPTFFFLILSQSKIQWYNLDDKDNKNRTNKLGIGKI